MLNHPLTKFQERELCLWPQATYKLTQNKRRSRLKENILKVLNYNRILIIIYLIEFVKYKIGIKSLKFQ